MLPLTITLTPTMITFKELPEELDNKFYDEFGLEWSDKGYYFIKDTPQELYKVLLQISYTYDLEVI